MKKKNAINKIGVFLEDLSLVLGGSQGCATIWGETPLPACVRTEIEEKLEKHERTEGKSAHV